jgi:septal ring factor EnvC (AmiA/AmiB activator)
MNRIISMLNLLGVVALVLLCCVQWQRNSRLENQAVDLQNVQFQQAATIDQQKRTIKDDAIDLSDLRQRLTMSESALQETREEKDRLAIENAQLKKSLQQWTQAVQQRDKVIAHANDLIQMLAKQRNEAVQKFNNLADAYNGLVKRVEADESK